MTYASPTYVEETRIGFRFLGSLVWQHHVLRVAIDDLKRLCGKQSLLGGMLPDVGCGQRKSYRLLNEAFQALRMIRLDGQRLMDGMDAYGVICTFGPVESVDEALFAVESRRSLCKLKPGTCFGFPTGVNS